MVTEVSPAQPQNVQTPMAFTVAGRVTEVRELHSKNKPGSIEVKVSGSSMDLSSLQDLKAYKPMLFKVSGSATEVRLLHSANTSSPIFSTPSGTTTV